MTTYYVIDKRSQEIVNAIETDMGVPSLDGFIEPEHLYVDAHPPMSTLERYRYWHERP